MKDQITAVHENELEIYNALHENGSVSICSRRWI